MPPNHPLHAHRMFFRGGRSRGRSGEAPRALNRRHVQGKKEKKTIDEPLSPAGVDYFGCLSALGGKKRSKPALLITVVRIVGTKKKGKKSCGA